MASAPDIDPELPLIVVAVDEEAEHLRDLGLPLLVTGAGKVNAASSVAGALAATRPAEVVNLGTAGGLADGLHGTHVVGKVVQHDLDDDALIALTGRSFSPELTIGDGPTLATGDVFVADSAVRAKLAERAQLVDMEGYGVAHAATAAGVPVRLVKHVSDPSDETALKSWADSVAACSAHLADWARLHLL